MHEQNSQYQPSFYNYSLASLYCFYMVFQNACGAWETAWPIRSSIRKLLGKFKDWQTTPPGHRIIGKIPGFSRQIWILTGMSCWYLGSMDHFFFLTLLGHDLFEAAMLMNSTWPQSSTHVACAALAQKSGPSEPSPTSDLSERNISPILGDGSQQSIE